MGNVCEDCYWEHLERVWLERIITDGHAMAISLLKQPSRAKTDKRYTDII